MSVTWQRKQQEREVLCTLLHDPTACGKLPENFDASAFEVPEYSAFFTFLIEEFISLARPITEEAVVASDPGMKKLVADTSYPLVTLAGKLRVSAAHLMLHRRPPTFAADQILNAGQASTQNPGAEAQAKPTTGPNSWNSAPGGRHNPPIEQARTPIPTLREYLSRVETFLRRYVVFPSEHESVAVTLWVAHSWIVDQFEISPILAVTSAEKRTGKTRVFDCIALLVPNPWPSILPSEAVTYTLLAQRPRRTMLLDEADAIWNLRTSERQEGLRAILNSGNSQGTPVYRVGFEKGKREVEKFDCYGPKAIAGIGELPSTIADRSVPVRLRRRSRDEPIAKFRRRQAKAEAQELCFDWETVTLVTDVPVPEELNDRAADSWEPLLAIADLAGGDWPLRARRAAVALSAEEQSPSIGMKLLADIQQVFGDEAHLEPSTLLSRLNELDDSPWGDWYGKPLTSHGLAKLLEPYGVHSVQRRLAGRVIRGYFRADLTDVWRRYCPALGSGTSGTSGTEAGV